MHRCDVQRSDAHLARNIQIELFFIQIGVFCQFKFTTVELRCLSDFILVEVFAGSCGCFCREINRALLHLQH